MYDLVLNNLKLVDLDGNFNIGINNGKINCISKTSLKGDKVVEFNDGEFLLPGLIDPHVHFRDPGLTYKEDFHTGSQSAANGGFTTVIDMPNTIPEPNTYKTFQEKVRIAEDKSIVNFKLNAGFNDSVDEMVKVAELEPASFKLFLDGKTDDELDECFKNLKTVNNEGFDFILSCHCEDKKVVEESTESLKDKNDSICYSYARPVESEVESVKKALKLGDKYDLKLHICHLSSKKSLSLIQDSNVDVSYEFTPHHIFLDNNYFNIYNEICKTNPPLRTISESVDLSSLDDECMIGTDHAPHSIDEKNLGVWDSKPGIPNLETVLSLFLTEVNNGNLSLSLISKIMSENPAKRFNLKNKGYIKEGYDADLTVVNLKKEGIFNSDDFYTKGKYTPFEKWDYKGKAVMTIVNGKIVMEDNIVY